MDKPADPATPFAEVYQSFLDDPALEGTKPSTIHRDRYAAGSPTASPREVRLRRDLRGQPCWSSM
jgi:hypothetical protein